jgi:glycosyltransferase involved in cell wall biosynthesis
VSVVIPTLNEAANLPWVLRRVPAWVHEIVVVDGLSTDDTVAVARASRPEVEIILETQPGKGAAMRSGFAAATGDIVVAMDADGSTDPRELPAFVGVLMSGADVALGSRFAVGGGTSDMELHRKVGNHALRHVVQVAFNARYSDLCYGYMAFWRDVLPLLDCPFDGFEIETVLHIRARQHRLNVAEVPSYEAPRISGTSNLNAFRDGMLILRTILRHRYGRSRMVEAPDWERANRRFRRPPWASGRAALDLTRVEEQDVV